MSAEGLGHSDAWLDDSDRPVVSIRERAQNDPDAYAVQNVPMPRYLLFNPERPENYLCVFGMVQGGETREEAVFWAERFASKQDYRYVAPEGWENVKGALPDGES